MEGAATARGEEVCCSMQVLACLPCFKMLLPWLAFCESAQDMEADVHAACL